MFTKEGYDEDHGGGDCINIREHRVNCVVSVAGRLKGRIGRFSGWSHNSREYRPRLIGRSCKIRAPIALEIPPVYTTCARLQRKSIRDVRNESHAAYSAHGIEVIVPIACSTLGIGSLRVAGCCVP